MLVLIRAYKKKRRSLICI